MIVNILGLLQQNLGLPQAALVSFLLVNDINVFLEKLDLILKAFRGFFVKNYFFGFVLCLLDDFLDFLVLIFIAYRQANPAFPGSCSAPNSMNISSQFRGQLIIDYAQYIFDI